LKAAGAVVSKKRSFQGMFQEEVSNPSVIKNGWHSILVGRDFD